MKAREAWRRGRRAADRSIPAEFSRFASDGKKEPPANTLPAA